MSGFILPKNIKSAIVKVVSNSYFMIKWYFTNEHSTKNVHFSIKDFFSKCDQIRRKLRIWSHLLKKSLLMENLIYCKVEASKSRFNEADLILRKPYKKIRCSHSDLYHNNAKLTWDIRFPSILKTESFKTSSKKK